MLSDVIQDVVGVFGAIAFVGAGAGWVFKKLNKSRAKEIDARIKAADERRTKEQEQGTPMEKQLKTRVEELTFELATVKDNAAKDIAALRAEINELRDRLLAAYQGKAAT